MADSKAAPPVGEHSFSSTSFDLRSNHANLGTTIPSSQLHHSNEHDPEKLHHEPPDVARSNKKKLQDDDEDEDEDIDALIDDLESQDGQEELVEEEEGAAGDTPPISEDLLQTSTRHGLSDAEVAQRRKKFGLNQMKEEKENMILKFLGYFVGPIQFVMEVS